MSDLDKLTDALINTLLNEHGYAVPGPGPSPAEYPTPLAGYPGPPAGYTQTAPVMWVMHAVSDALAGEGMIGMTHDALERALACICEPFPVQPILMPAIVAGHHAIGDGGTRLSAAVWVELFRPLPWTHINRRLPVEVRDLPIEAARTLLHMHCSDDGVRDALARLDLSDYNTADLSHQYIVSRADKL